MSKINKPIIDSNKTAKAVVITSNTNNPSSEIHSEIKAEEITDVLIKYSKSYNNFTTVCSIIAFILSWRCNNEKPLFEKILYGIIALLLSWRYLIFYFIYYSYMENDCKNDIVLFK